jgi:hypothetical protein
MIWKVKWHSAEPGYEGTPQGLLYPQVEIQISLPGPIPSIVTTKPVHN